jgi:aminoglycoside phosphotransferase (APT) family kinase protein
MHADEHATSVPLVRRLLAAQFPEWAGLPLERVPAAGTDNTLYRLGRDKVVRLPRREVDVERLRKERRWLPWLAPRLPLEIPVPLAEGRPGQGYPFEWSIYRWLDGEAAERAPVADLARAAADLAELVLALQRLDPTGAPPPGDHNAFRGEPLAARDAATRAALAALGDRLDVDAAAAVWEEALGAPAWDRPPVWIHGDLDARNLLVADGRLRAVIDFGCLGAGDPACDVMVAWKLLRPAERRLFRDALAVDEATWARARGWALSQALVALAYYTLDTNPVLVHEARRWLRQVLADAGSGAPPARPIEAGG